MLLFLKKSTNITISYQYLSLWNIKKEQPFFKYIFKKQNNETTLEGLH